MTEVTLKDLTLDQLLDALPNLVVDGNEETFVYDVSIEGEDERVTKNNFWIKIDKAEVTVGEGESGDPEACSFQVMMGGVDTIIAMQVEGLAAATNLMIMGYIFPSDIPKAEAWFRILKTGEAAVVEALEKAGYKVVDTTIPLLEELNLD